MRSRLILVAVLVLAGASCGGDDDDDADATDGPEAVETTAAGTEAAGGEATIVISGFAFPDETTVAAGEPITVRNDDGATHTVTALEGAFNVEVPGGETVTIDPLEPGSYDFVCNFHGGMSGTLLVE